MLVKTSLIKKDTIRSIINGALDQLYEKDQYLIYHDSPIRRFSHVSERGIVFRLGIYVDQRLRSNDYNLFDGYNLDAEYNRNINNVKCIPTVEKGAYPDLIIHNRGNNNYNLLAIEIKPWWVKLPADENNKDLNKLRDFTTEPPQQTTFEVEEKMYKYKYGLFIVISQFRQDIELKWFQSGEGKKYDNLDINNP